MKRGKLLHNLVFISFIGLGAPLCATLSARSETVVLGDIRFDEGSQDKERIHRHFLTTWFDNPTVILTIVLGALAVTSGVIWLKSKGSRTPQHQPVTEPIKITTLPVKTSEDKRAKTSEQGNHTLQVPGNNQNHISHAREKNSKEGLFERLKNELAAINPREGEGDSLSQISLASATSFWEKQQEKVQAHESLLNQILKQDPALLSSQQNQITLLRNRIAEVKQLVSKFITPITRKNKKAYNIADGLDQLLSGMLMSILKVSQYWNAQLDSLD